MTLQHLIVAVQNLNPVIDPVEVEAEEADVISEHLRVSGWIEQQSRMHRNSSTMEKEEIA